jgi:2-keto-4-pentenoate hydratase/2-oxohepta-3-ene-1,7-dioic acid hydratase in catechol pathway
LDVIAGYTIGNDVTARTVQFSTSQWSLAKSFPTFCPLGPGITPRSEVTDPGNLGLHTVVNGVEMQRGNTRDLRVGLRELVLHLARHVPLLPGDVILTGTPEGVGHFRSPPVYLRAGDVVEVSIEGIGTLRNKVRAPVASRASAPGGQ